MEYTARHDHDRNCESIRNSDLSDDEKQPLIDAENNNLAYVIETEIRKRKAENNDSSSSTSSSTTIYFPSSSSSSNDDDFDEKLEEFLTNTAKVLAKLIMPVAKLLPPFILGCMSAGNIEDVEKASNFEKSLLEDAGKLNIFEKLSFDIASTTPQIAIGCCAAWGALSLVGTYLSYKGKELSEISDPDQTKLNLVRLQQVAALACLGFVFYNTIESLDQNPSLEQKTNALLIVSAAGLAYQGCSCYLKNKKIRIYESS